MSKDDFSSLRTCVSPEGRFVYGLHRPCFSGINLRTEDLVLSLGHREDGATVLNTVNFPAGDVDEPCADPIFEIPNPFPFKGTTYIGKAWADRSAENPGAILIPGRPPASLSQTVQDVLDRDGVAEDRIDQIFARLPRPFKLAVAAASSDPADLVRLAGSCCELIYDPATHVPSGIVFTADARGRLKPRICDKQLFDTVANNPCLPDAYKEVMALRPGVQGQSEIVGSWRRNGSHVFEYLRRNSYIPWGHYAANMAHDAVRYAVGDLNAEDMRGMRHLYYQRTYVRLAEALHLKVPVSRREISVAELEQVRRSIYATLNARDPAVPLPFSATLWGWNYGFDYAPNGYRLHASHQQIHQQYALIPMTVPSAVANGDHTIPAFACGDMIHDFIRAYRRCTGRPFFECYQKAIDANRRMDGRTDRPSDLIVHRDAHVLLFVPKAQTSQWELQLMTRGPAGNILETDEAVRRALDEAMLLAMRVLTAMGATMITVIEYSKRFDIADCDQRLLYAFLPRLPESPGAFSEAQLRWINGHYPEDFALACRMKAATFR
jgi:hypothetical protein